MKFTLYYPTDPWYVSQKWGVPNPAYAQFGFTRHNGIDHSIGDGNIYCPIPCTVIKMGYQETGAGQYITLVTTSSWDVNGLNCYIEITFMHMVRGAVYCLVGDKLQIGDIIGRADNTGFSTGPHVHFRCRRVRQIPGGWENIDKNDVDGTFDQAPFFNGISAKTVKVLTLRKLLLELQIKLINLLKGRA